MPVLFRDLIGGRLVPRWQMRPAESWVLGPLGIGDTGTVDIVTSPVIQGGWALRVLGKGNVSARADYPIDLSGYEGVGWFEYALDSSQVTSIEIRLSSVKDVHYFSHVHVPVAASTLGAIYGTDLYGAGRYQITTISSDRDWRLYEIPKDQFTIVGTPAWADIQRAEFRITGLAGSALTYEFWFDSICGWTIQDPYAANANRLMSKLPESYWDEPTNQVIAQALGWELDALQGQLTYGLGQRLLANAEWGLRFHEVMRRLPVDPPSYSEEKRRNRMMMLLQQNATNPELVAAISTICDANVTLLPTPSTYSVVALVPIIDTSKTRDRVLTALEQLLPAHLQVLVDYDAFIVGVSIVGSSLGGSPALPSPPAQRYSIPGGAISVNSSATLLAALANGTAHDIVIENGTYTIGTAGVAPAAGHRLWCRNYHGATFFFGLDWGNHLSWEVHGGIWNVPSHAAVDGSDTAVFLNSFGASATNAKISDVTLTGGGATRFGIRLGQPGGAIIQRVKASGFTYDAVRLSDDSLSSTAIIDTVSDIDSTTIGSGATLAGAAEYGLWVGHQVTNGVSRVRTSNADWGGIFCGNAAKLTTYSDLTVSGGKVGVYLGPVSRNLSYQRFQLTNVVTGFDLEWWHFDNGGTYTLAQSHAIQAKDNSISFGLIDCANLASSRGIFNEWGSLNTTIDSVQISNATIAAIHDRGSETETVGTLLYAPDYGYPGSSGESTAVITNLTFSNCPFGVEYG